MSRPTAILASSRRRGAAALRAAGRTRQGTRTASRVTRSTQTASPRTVRSSAAAGVARPWAPESFDPGPPESIDLRHTAIRAATG